MIDHDDWGKNNCNFETSSAKDCSKDLVGNEASTFCLTTVQSYDQEDFSGFRETRECGSKFTERGIQHILILFFITFESREPV